MPLMSSFSVFDSEGGEVLGTKEIQYIKHHPILKFKNLELQVVLVLQVSLV
jgi:hypothetical protein